MFDEIRAKRGLEKDAQVALLMDGHCSRWWPGFSELLKQNNIAVILGASHTSHGSQVMDVGPMYMLEEKKKEASREEKGIKQYGENAALKTSCIAIKATVRAYMDTTYHDSNVSAFQNAGIFVMKDEDGPVLKIDPSVVLLKTGPQEQILTPLTPPRKKAQQSAVINAPRTIKVVLTASSMKAQTQFQVV